MSGYRLPNRARLNAITVPEMPCQFHFDGKEYEGFAGDTLASALIANGESVLARSFKYHRPRGLFSAGSEEPNVLVTIDKDARREPNQRATMVQIYDGLVASSQNCWPSRNWDIGAVNNFAGKLFAAGFYYKTFMGPSNNSWMLYEYFIRKAAGMGRGSLEADPDRYEQTSIYPDLLIIGSGPAGLQAACHAARAGASVILCEEQPYFGGSLLGDFAHINNQRTNHWAQACIDELLSYRSVTLLANTVLYGTFDNMTFAGVEQLDGYKATASPRQRHWTFRTKQLIVATGRVDRPLVFPGNDKPGVMLLDGVRTLALKYGVATGKKVVLFANNDSVYGALADLSKAGVNVTHVVDCRTDVALEYAEQVRRVGSELIKASVICGTGGFRKLTSVQIAKWENGRIRGGSFGIECDCLAVSGGTTPLVHLGSQQGMQPVWNEHLSAFTMPLPAGTGWHGAGAVIGEYSLHAALKSGQRAATAALEALDITPKPASSIHITNLDLPTSPNNIAPLWDVPSPADTFKQKAFVDLQHDVTVDDIKLAKREGYSASEHLKRYTTLGMGVDQGKTSTVNGMALMANQLNVPISKIGTTRFRPPFSPVSLGSIAGEPVRSHLRPLRKTPMHQWHVDHGAEMMNIGLWQRPRVYYQGSETLEEAYIREARAVRQFVGICDVSTLGKIDVQGPDAAEFLNRLYTNSVAKLPVGKARYGLMLRKDGFLFDDGTTWRLSKTQFLTTTTTANAALVMAQMEYYLNVWWPDLKVHLTSVTDQWASAALAGPKSQTVLGKVTEDDVSTEALGFMDVRSITIEKIKCLVARLSFSGERAYEIFWPANHGDYIWRKLLNAGKPFNITPYGIEALGTLRIEKGHIASNEMDGRVTARDLGLGALCSSRKDYVGKALMNRPALMADGRLQLIGLVAKAPFALTSGTHLVRNETMQEPAESEGHVSSPTYSPVMEKYIALGMLKNGRKRHGETIYASDPLGGSHHAVEIVNPVFYDPKGKKMHG